MFMYRITGWEIYVFLLPGQEGVLVFQLMRFPQGEKLCTADIGIDLLLRSDPDIYLPANCKRQDPLSEERERLTEK